MTVPAANLSTTNRPTEFIAGQVLVSRYRGTFRIQRTMSLVNQEELNMNGVVVREDLKIEFFAPRVPVFVDLRQDDSFFIWPQGMYLDQVALKFYGDPTLWWLIADFNNIRDPRVIEDGRTLRLPSFSRFLLEILPLLR